MNGNAIYIEIDVDDLRYHGSALDRRTGEALSMTRLRSEPETGVEFI